MRTYFFNVVVGPDEDADGNPAWHAYCPVLVEIGGATSGRTREEALQNINEVVQMVVEGLLEDGQPIPREPSDQVEVVEVSIDAPRIAVTA